jgi:hypothetical protein
VLIWINNKLKLAVGTKEGMHLSTLATEMASYAFPGLDEYQEPESPYNNSVELQRKDEPAVNARHFLRQL